MALAQSGENGIVDRIERCEIEMPAFGCLDPVSALAIAPEMRDTQPRARTQHAHCSAGGQRLVRTCQMQELFGWCVGHRVRYRLEIVDNGEALTAQLAGD